VSTGQAERSAERSCGSGGERTAPAAADGALLRDVLHGLAPDVRKLPPKYFYDEVGAQLFERITGLEAYYPTRTELAILEQHMPEMASLIGPRARIIEFGSGSGLKTRLLLEHLDRPVAYTPIDISCEQLEAFADSVREEFPALEAQPVCGDYMRTLALPVPGEVPARTLAFFPGSTLGNFEEPEAAAFLQRVATLCGPGGVLLLGTDMHKDTVVLERAYNDEEGVTAAFNLNVLSHINRATAADFNPKQWRHHAFYDEIRLRIEMRLVCESDCVVTVPTGEGDVERFEFARGEYITTEYSHKYTPESVRALAARTGWHVERVWMDEDCWFAVWLLQVSSQAGRARGRHWPGRARRGADSPVDTAAD
jgi:dimethylhistidine N-methyltransferase